MKYALLAVGILFNVMGQLFLKRGAMASAHSDAEAHKSFLSFWFLGGVVSLGVAMLLWVLVLRRLPLNVAHPVTIGSCLVLVALASHAFWGEPLPKSRIAGIALILGGVYLAAHGIH